VGEAAIMIDVICWKWEPPPLYRSQFRSVHVNILRHQVRRHLPIPHRFSCITDNPKGIEPGIRIIPLWKDFANLSNPNVRGGPSCYRRLKAFSKEARQIIGKRILSIDLDCVIVDDITPLVARDEDFVCWGDTAKGTHYNGGLWLLTAGARSQVWETFDPISSPKETKRQRIVGSDQAWISCALGGNEAKWGTEDGVYSFRNHIHGHGSKLPDNAKIVLFHGGHDPWHVDVQFDYPWVKEYYK